MITLISLASMQVPDYTKVANNNSAKTAEITFQGDRKFVQPSVNNYKAYGMVSFKGYSAEYKLPEDNQTGFKTFDEVIAKYTPQMQNVMQEFNARKNGKGQYLNWPDLPQNQLNKNSNGVRHLDEIYSQAASMSAKKNADNSDRPLVVLGIGGSKHTVEFLLNMNGVGNKGKVYFYSDIDPVSFNNFLKETGKKPNEMNYLVASKSGTTFETADGFKRFENAVIAEYKKQGLSSKDAAAEAEKHFAICTDKTAKGTNLRAKIGDKNGVGNNYTKELYIHDDVGGRYSMFDDAGLFALAYAGVDKNTAETILKSAAKTSKILTNPKMINNNEAAKSAIYNVFSRDNNFKMIQQQYFGKLFQGAGENWAKQLYLESLKDFDFAVGCAPESMHYATEGQFSPENRKSYNTIMTVMNPKISNNYQKYVGAIAKTYNETTPLKIEKLDVDSQNRITPDTIGKYIQTKHFETVYTGMLRRETSAQQQALPEVLQPSVETYKNKFKQGEFKLNPGE